MVVLGKREGTEQKKKCTAHLLGQPRGEGGGWWWWGEGSGGFTCRGWRRQVEQEVLQDYTVAQHVVHLKFGLFWRSPGTFGGLVHTWYPGCG